MRPRFPRAFIICFIMPLACSNWRMRALTSCTVVPLPAAMRLRRLALRMPGFRRFARGHAADDGFGLFHGVLVDFDVGQLVAHAREHARACSAARPSFSSAASGSRKSSRVSWSREPLLDQLSGLVAVKGLLRLFDERQHVAHAQNAAGHAVGVEGLDIGELLARCRMNLMGLPVTARTDRAAPPRVSPSSLVRITPSMPSSVVEGLGHVDRVLAGHGVHNQQDLLGLDGSRLTLLAAPPSARSSMCRRPAVSRIITSLP